jgi:hypothetical protein
MTSPTPARTSARTSPLARLLLDLAVRAVPAGHRERYAREFAAELHEVPAGQRFRYTLGLLLAAPALRSALSGATAPAPHEVVRARKPLRCRLGRHRWGMQSAEDGTRFEACLRCDKDRPPGNYGSGGSEGSWSAMGVGGGLGPGG